MRILWFGPIDLWLQLLIDSDSIKRLSCIAHETLQEQKWDKLEELVEQYDRVVYNAGSESATLHALMLAVLCREQDTHFTLIAHGDDTKDIIPFVLSRMKNVLIFRIPERQPKLSKWTTIVLDILQRGYDGEFLLDETCERLRNMYALHFR
jgi:hypothetical protein